MFFGTIAATTPHQDRERLTQRAAFVLHADVSGRVEVGQQIVETASKDLFAKVCSALELRGLHRDARISAARSTAFSSIGVADVDLREFRHWLSEVWNEVAGDGAPNHLLARTSVERVRRAGAPTRYVSGYASKADQTRPGEKVVRYWRVVGRENVSWGTTEIVSLSEKQSAMMLRTARRFVRAVNRQSRINRVAKMVALKPSELTSWGGWFEGNGIHYGSI